MAQSFTFKFTEKQLSIVQDALDLAVETGYSNEHFSTEDIAEVAGEVADRLAY